MTDDPILYAAQQFQNYQKSIDVLENKLRDLELENMFLKRKVITLEKEKAEREKLRANLRRVKV